MNLTLKDASPELAKLLKQRAKDNHRTLSEEVIAYLVRNLHSRETVRISKTAA